MFVRSLVTSREDPWWDFQGSSDEFHFWANVEGEKAKMLKFDFAK